MLPNNGGTCSYVILRNQVVLLTDDNMALRSPLLFLCVLILIPACVHADLVNEEVTRKVDLTTQVAEYAVNIVLKNSGPAAAKEFVYAVEPSLAGRLAYISGQADGKKLDMTEEQRGSDKDGLLFKVALPSPLQTGSAVTVSMETIFSHAIEAHPAKIGQNDKQLVRFTANVYHFSPYATTTQTTTVVLPTASPESYTRVKPVAAQDTNIVYGPYPNMAAHSSKPVTLHFENNSPFMTVMSLNRLIEVSHWGNIAVEEEIIVRHSGAELRGAFSRYDFQRMPQSGQASVKSYKTLLPASAQDVYYRDEIGNISTSHLREEEDAVEMELRPRFPLFGGWQTKYTVGYNVPSYEYLYHKGKQFLLSMRFVDHIFDEQVIDEVNLRVILPEGSKNIHLKTVYPVTEKERELQYTYLDTTGRPVVIATKSNLVEQHIQDFELSYEFEVYLLLLEPLVVTGALYLFFLVVIMLVRLDFTISEDESALAKQRASVVIEKIVSLTDERLALVKKLESSVSKGKQVKHAQPVQQELKSVTEKWKLASGKVDEEIGKLSQDAPDAVGKVKDIQSKAAALLSVLERTVGQAVLAIDGKVDLSKYEKEEKSMTEDRKRLVHHISDLLRTL